MTPGSNQAAAVYLSQIDPAGTGASLLLKRREADGVLQSEIQVGYLPAYQQVYVNTYDTQQGWLPAGPSVGATFVDGDRLAAVAGYDGVVRVYRNNELLGSFDVSAWPHNTEGGRIGLGISDTAIRLDNFAGGNLDLPAVTSENPTILDDFERRDGNVSQLWSGDRDWAYELRSGELGTTEAGGADMFWRSASYGPDQEAYITLTNFDANSLLIGLILKSQSDATVEAGAVQVLFSPMNGTIMVRTFDPQNGWVQVGTEDPVTFVPGDRLGARAGANGLVTVYQNENAILTRDVSAWPLAGSGGFIGLTAFANQTVQLDNFGGGSVSANLMVFPAKGVLDNFSRPNGSINNNWEGWDEYFAISSGKLAMEGGSLLFWNQTKFGVDQEASLDLANISASAGVVSLVLKSQSSTTWEDGMLGVDYIPWRHQIGVNSYSPEHGWAQMGAMIPANFISGDRLRAVARANGSVEVYRNDTLLGIRDISSWLYYQADGYIGLSAGEATGTEVDNFGGGNVTSLQSRLEPAAGKVHLALLPPPVVSVGESGLPALSMDQVQHQADGLPAPAGAPVQVTIEYEYDPLYRLTAADYSNGNYYHYEYDAAGNRLNEETFGGVETTYQYDIANRLTSVNGTAYTWDANGNLLSDGTTNYTFNHANQMAAVTGTNGTAQHQYNGLGDRVGMNENGQVTLFTLDLAE